MTAVERAFQLARSGSVAGLAEITTSLNREGYYANQIEGPVLKRQLAELILREVERHSSQLSGSEKTGFSA